MWRASIKKIISILLCSILLCGCATEQEVVEKEKKPVEIIEPEMEPEMLSFVDVYQKEYEIAINPNVTRCIYEKDAFLLSNGRMSYKGEEYIHRLGIDVSKYQGDIDWKKVKADGVEFAFIRLGFRGYGEEGTLNLDDKFEQNLRGATDAGVDVGVYFFAQAINEEEAIEEAEFVLKHLEGYELQMPIVYDPETIQDDEARTDFVSGEQFSKNTAIFCQTIEKAGYNSMVYCNMVWQAYMLDLEELSEYPIWYADYERYPQTPYHFEVWQYSEEGTVDGIDGNVDLNIQLMKK